MNKFTMGVGVCLAAGLMGFNAYAVEEDDFIPVSVIQTQDADEVSPLKVNDGDEIVPAPEAMKRLVSEIVDPVEDESAPEA